MVGYGEEFNDIQDMDKLGKELENLLSQGKNASLFQVSTYIITQRCKFGNKFLKVVKMPSHSCFNL